MTRGGAALPCEEIAARGEAGWEVAFRFLSPLLEEERRGDGRGRGRRRWRINER